MAKSIDTKSIDNIFNYGNAGAFGYPAYSQIVFNSPNKLEIDINSINYTYNEIVESITDEIEQSGGKFSGAIMDAAYSIYYKQNRSLNDNPNISINAIAAVLHKTIGYHYVMSILMKYMKNKDLDYHEWKAVCDFLYNEEKKPYELDLEDRMYKIKKNEK